MSINITHTMNGFQFESRENLRDAARNLLNRKGASEDTINSIMDKSIMQNRFEYPIAQVNMIHTYSQLNTHNNIQEKLNNLKKQAAKIEPKRAILGELWNKIEGKNVDNVIEFQINTDVENIFA